jgi:hypothetical protein
VEKLVLVSENGRAEKGTYEKYYPLSDGFSSIRTLDLHLQEKVRVCVGRRKKKQRRR